LRQFLKEMTWFFSTQNIWKSWS